MNFVLRILLVLVLPVFASCDMKYSSDPSEIIYGEVSELNAQEDIDYVLRILSEHGFNVVPYGPGVDYGEINQNQYFHSSDPDYQLVVQILPQQKKLVITLFPARFGKAEKFIEVTNRFNFLRISLSEAAFLN